jgi:hypothetical protein
VIVEMKCRDGCAETTEWLRAVMPKERCSVDHLPGVDACVEGQPLSPQQTLEAWRRGAAWRASPA